MSVVVVRGLPGPVIRDDVTLSWPLLVYWDSCSSVSWYFMVGDCFVWQCFNRRLVLVLAVVASWIVVKKSVIFVILCASSRAAVDLASGHNAKKTLHSNNKQRSIHRDLVLLFGYHKCFCALLLFLPFVPVYSTGTYLSWPTLHRPVLLIRVVVVPFVPPWPFNPDYEILLLPRRHRRPRKSTRLSLFASLPFFIRPFSIDRVCIIRATVQKLSSLQRLSKCCLSLACIFLSFLFLQDVSASHTWSCCTLSILIFRRSP